MNVDNNAPGIWQNWVVPCSKTMIKASLYVPVFYLAIKAEDLSDRQVYLLGALYGPPAAIYLTGAMEAIIRSTVLAAGSFFANTDNETKKENALIELNTAHQFVRNALSPLSGWSAIMSDGYHLYKDSQDKRIIFKEYYSYKIAYHAGVQPYKIIKAATVHVISPTLTRAFDLSVRTTKVVVDCLDRVGVWNCLGAVANWSVQLIEKSVGFAVNSLNA